MDKLKLIPITFEDYKNNRFKYIISDKGLFCKLSTVTDVFNEIDHTTDIPYSCRTIYIDLDYFPKSWIVKNLYFNIRKDTCHTAFYKIPEEYYHPEVIKMCLKNKYRIDKYEEQYNLYTSKRHTKVAGLDKVQYAKHLIDSGKTFSETLNKTARDFGIKNKKALLRLLSEKLSPLFSNVEVLDTQNKNTSIAQNIQVIDMDNKSITLGELDV